MRKRCSGGGGVEVHIFNRYFSPLLSELLVSLSSWMERSEMLNYGVNLSKLILDAISNRNYDSARDYTLQIISIFNLFIVITKNIGSTPTVASSARTPLRVVVMNENVKKIFKICLEAVEKVLLQLTGYLQISSSALIPSSGPAVSKVLSTQNKITHSSSVLREISFQNIIGSDDAKQILYENVILPLSLSASMRSQIFQGIRATVGNVLLFGPPGTG
jgi:ATP-dependent 26S proteasome regulatory subunit